MKVQIRKGVFETNSSSTHAMAVEANYRHGCDVLSLHHRDINTLDDNEKDKLNNRPFPVSVDFTPGEFGWEEATYKDCNNKASYLITAMLSLLDYDEFDNKVKEIRKWLSDEGIEMIIPEYTKKEYYDYGVYQANFQENKDQYFYIDHVDEADIFMCYVIATKTHLFNYLFGDSIVKTGNDNDGTDISFYTSRDKDGKYPDTDEGWDFMWKHKIFYKGN